MTADTMTKDQTIQLQAAEIEKLRAEVEPLRIALGLLATIKPTMEIDVTDPVGMAQQIAAHVADKIERLRELLRDILADQQTAHWHEDIKVVLGD